MPCTFAFLALLACQELDKPATVVINEFVYDNSGPDVIEFVELYNTSTEPADISGWVIDSEDESGPNASYTVPDGTVIAPNGFWTIGADAANPGNIDQVVGVTDLWENDTESLTLRNQFGTRVDTVVYESSRGTFDVNLAEGVGLCAPLVSPNARPVSWSRCPDGRDTFDNPRDFHPMPATPAAPNHSLTVVPFNSTFDAQTPGDPVAEFIGSFVDPVVIDPTVVGPAFGSGNHNPNVIPPSPTGGNASVYGNPNGGGNASWLVSRCLPNVLIEGCVYFPGGLAPAGEGETWTIGLRGTVGSDADVVDPSGQWTTDVGPVPPQGNTGIGMVWERTSTYNKVFLVDFTDCKVLKVLGEIDIVENVNDGWQFFSFSVLETSVWLRVGDPAGAIQAQTQLTLGAGGVYCAYRESFSDDSATRPLTLDDFMITIIGAGVEEFGRPVPNHLSVPRLQYSGLPVLGTNNRFIGFGVLPNAPSFLLVGVKRELPVPLPSPLFPPGAELYVWILDSIAASSADALVTMPWPIPYDRNVLGGRLAFQLVQLDAALPYGIPLTHSEGVLINIGSRRWR